MKYLNKEVDFNDKVTGTNKIYNAWAFEIEKFKNISDINHFVALASYINLRESNIIRKYSYIAFFENLEEFRKIDFPDDVKNLFLIEVKGAKEANKIIIDIMSNNKNESSFELNRIIQ